MKTGRYEESIAKYEQALEIEPTFIASYIGIGNNQMFMDRYMTSGFATGGRRDRIQSKKSRTWFICLPVRPT